MPDVLWFIIVIIVGVVAYAIGNSRGKGFPSGGSGGSGKGDIDD